MRIFSANSQVRIVRSENDILKHISTKAETLRPSFSVWKKRKTMMHLLCSLLWSGVEWVVVWVCPGVRLMLTLLPSVRRSRTWGRRVPLVTGSPLLSSPASCSFRCLQLPQATLTSHPYSLHYSTNHTVIWDHSYFSCKNPRLLFHCTIVKEVPSLRLFLHLLFTWWNLKETIIYYLLRILI